MPSKPQSWYLERDCGTSRRASGAHDTEFPQRCQLFDTKNMKSSRPTGFGSRLRQAFGERSNVEIARLLGVSNSTLTDYMKGKTFPTAEGLLRIAEITKHSIHWLLTGEGTDNLDPLRFLDTETRSVVERLAGDEKKKIEALVRDLVHEALMKRGADLFLMGEGRLRARELEQLRMLVDLAASEAEREEKTG